MRHQKAPGGPRNSRKARLFIGGVALLVAVPGLFLACSEGRLGGGSKDTNGDDLSSGADSLDGGDDSSNAAVQATSSAIRRLSNEELLNSYAVLTGIRPQEISQLPPDARQYFDRVVNTQTVGQAHLDGAHALASEVIERLFAESKLDELSAACSDNILPPSMVSSLSSTSGAGLSVGPEWSLEDDPNDASRLISRYAADPTASTTFNVPAPGTFDIVLKGDVSNGKYGSIELQVDGTVAGTELDVSGPFEFTVRREFSAVGAAVLFYQFAGDVADNPAIEFDFVSVEGPLDPGAGKFDTERAKCADALLADFAPLAYRHPLLPGQEDRLRKLFDEGASETWGTGISLLLHGIFNNPHFLYLIEVGELETQDESAEATLNFRLDAYELAARLSYGLCEQPPDAELRKLAADGTLLDDNVLTAQTKRLFGQDCARASVTRFLEAWLHLDQLPDLTKDPQLYPEFTEEVRAGMVSESKSYLTQMIWEKEASLTEFFVSRAAWPDERSASVFSMNANNGAEEEWPAHRAGALTLPGVLAVAAPFGDTSPVTRGVFVLERILCQELPKPPIGVDIAPPPPDPKLPARQRWEAHSSEPACANCHEQMDPVGFVFEEFDAIGRHRTEDNGSPVDASGGAPVLEVPNGELQGAAELMALISTSPVAAECFAKQWMRFSLGSLESEGDTTAKNLGELAQTQSALATLKALIATERFRLRLEDEE